MNSCSIIDKIRAEYIDENLESAKKIKYSDMTEKEGIITVLYKDLPQTSIEGYPFASDYADSQGKSYSYSEYKQLSEEKKRDCQLRFYYLPYSHELYIGTTGSGKTTGCVEPQLRAVSSQKNKPNLFLTDPKGELFDRNAQHLKDQGYITYVLNFKEVIRSDRWNPLLELYDLKIECKSIGNSAITVYGNPEEGLVLMSDKKSFKNTFYIKYKGKAFPDIEYYNKYLQFERDVLEAKVDDLMNQLANMMIIVQSKNDKSWEYGAQDLLKGLLQCMLEDAVDESSGFTRDMMTFQTIQKYYLAIKNPILGDEFILSTHPLLKKKSEKAHALLATALGNAPNTMRSYCGVFDSAMKNWFQGHIFALTTGQTVFLDTPNDKPFAIFLITRDYEKSDFLIAGLFIDWIYRQMLERAEICEKPRALHFLLDEFGNIPEIKDLENKISTSRSRNIWFHLVVQSYKQIDLVYGSDRSVVIRDNCNSQIFLGAQNRTTKEIFSNECGKHFIPTLESKLNATNYSIQEVPLIPVSDLDLISPGQMYVKRLYMPVILSQFIRSYECAEHGDFNYFKEANGLETCTPIMMESFTSNQYCYSKLKQIPQKRSLFDVDI